MPTELSGEQVEQLERYYNDEQRKAEEVRGSMAGTEAHKAQLQHEAHLGTLRYALQVLGYTVVYESRLMRFVLRPL